MAKYWKPGKVKTRLGATIGLNQSAELHKAFVLHLCEQLSDHTESFELVASPDESSENMKQAIHHDIGKLITTVCQGDGDLGERMERWFASKLSEQVSSQSVSSKPGHSPAVSEKAILIGADCPTLARQDIAEAFRQLNDHPFVLGPALDGGYYLIGIAGPWNDDYRNLFRGIAWSTSEVFAETRRQIDAINASVAVLQTREDVDTVAELDRLRASLTTSDRSDSASRQQPSNRLPTSLDRLAHAIENILSSPEYEKSRAGNVKPRESSP